MLGYGVSATGFSIAGSRIHKDREFFDSLYATSFLLGAPADGREEREYILGGPLGNALMNDANFIAQHYIIFSRISQPQ